MAAIDLHPLSHGWRVALADDLTVDAESPEVRRGAVRVTLTIRNCTTLYYRDTVNLTSARDRTRVMRTLGEKQIAGLEMALLEQALIALDEVYRSTPSEDGAELLARVGDAEDVDGLAWGARQDDDSRNPALRYRAIPEGLIWSKPTKEGPTDVLLSNFAATITGEITEDDGVETRKRFALTAQLNGHMHSFEIPAAQFAGMSWVTEHLGATAIVMPGMTLKDHARAAIQLLSPHVETRHVYTHLGWRHRAEGWCYLHAGGAIGAHGAVLDVTVALGPALSGYELPAPPDDDARRAAIRTSLALLEVAPAAVAIPTYAALWRAVLGNVDCGLHLAGPTGQGKTALAALIQQHWGAELDARRLPASWSSTGNALEGLAFAVKDAVLVVDDFCPTGTKADIQRFHRDADRLLRAQGNRSGRQRMRADSTLRPTRPPRGLILSTGEDIPRGQSLRARVLMLDIAPGMVDWAQLTACQEAADTGVYGQALAGFVQWLAPRYGEVSHGLSAELRSLRQQALQGSHRRTPDIIANLALGMQYFLAYAHDCGALTPDECRTYWERTWQALGAAATAQHEHQASEEPVDRFRALLAAALTAGLAHVASATTRTDPPLLPEHWGWRGHEQGIGDATTMVWHPLGGCIGWVHGDRLYLDPEAAFSVVQRLADSQQAPFPLTQQTLWKRLHERGVLRREAAQHKNQVRRVIAGKTEYVIDIPAYYVAETGHCGHSGHSAPQGLQNQQIPDDLFPVWYEPKPVIDHAAQPVIAPRFNAVEDNDRFPREAMTDFRKGIGHQNEPATSINSMSMTGMTAMTGNGASRGPTVGDWVLPLSADGVIIPDKDVPPPYVIGDIHQGSDGLPYALFLATGKYWPLERCERTDPPTEADGTPTSDGDAFDEVVI